MAMNKKKPLLEQGQKQKMRKYKAYFLTTKLSPFCQEKNKNNNIRVHLYISRLCWRASETGSSLDGPGFFLQTASCENSGGLLRGAKPPLNTRFNLLT